MREYLNLFLVCITLCLATSCRESVDKTTSTKRVKVEVITSYSSLHNISSYPARVEAQRNINLSFRIAGVVDKIVKREGDFVRKDEVIAYLDSRDYKLQLDATQAEYNAIKGEVERIIALYQSDGVTTNDYEKAVSGLEQITAKLSLHKNALEDTALRAPEDGYIQSIKFHRGEALAAGHRVASFISASAPEITINIPVKEYLRLNQVECAEARISSLGNKSYPLELISVTKSANLNQLYQARYKFIVSNSKEEYPPKGVSASVWLNYPTGDDDTTLAPTSALVERDNHSYVWVVSNGTAQEKRVEVGDIRGDGLSTILSGVQMGDSIIIAGLSSLKQGQQVEPLKKL